MNNLPNLKMTTNILNFWKIKLENFRNSAVSYNVLALLYISPKQPEQPITIWEKFIAFCHLWPLSQWILSISSLFILYGVTGHYYNKWLSDKGGWLTFQTRIWLIVTDLVLNLVLGIYYMGHRETLMGTIMMKCPIAISPAIFMLELMVVYFYWRYAGKFPWESFSLRFWQKKKTDSK